MEKTSCYNDPFLKLNFTRIDKKIQEFQRSSIQLIKQLDDINNDSAQNIAAEFKKDIEGFKEKLWLIELLTTEALIKKPLYWKDIAKECNIPNLEPNSELTFKVILNVGLAEHKDIIEEISKKADRQWSLEKKLNLIT